VVSLGLGLGSCLVRFHCYKLFISGIDYITHHALFGWFGVHCDDGFCIGFILFIVLWDIAHAVFLPLLAFTEPPCAGVESPLVSLVN